MKSRKLGYVKPKSINKKQSDKNKKQRKYSTTKPKQETERQTRKLGNVKSKYKKQEKPARVPP